MRLPLIFHPEFRRIIAIAAIPLLLVACATPSTPAVEPTPTALDQPTREPTSTDAPPTRTPRPTAGPDLTELLATPNARAAAADLVGAIDDYQRLTRLYPNSAEPWLGLSAIAQRQADWESALEYLETAATVDPENQEALRQWALLLEARGDTAGVVEVYDRMVGANPDDPNLLIARAQANARIGETASALADLLAAEKLDPSRDYAWLNVAGSAYGSRKYQTAIDIATEGLSGHSESTGLLMQRGLALISLGSIDEAAADFDTASQVDPSLAAAFHWKGRALLAKGHYSEAAEALTQAADLGVKSGVQDVNLAYESMAFAADAIARDDIDDAFAYLADNVIIYGSRDPLMMGYGFVRWRQGSIDQSFARFDALVKSGYTPALYWRGALYADQKDRGSAIQDLQNFLSIERAGPEVEAARAILESLGVDPDEVTPTP